jgi:hypothetical protein
MSRHLTPIDISNIPDLVRIVEEMKHTKEPHILKRALGEVDYWEKRIICEADSRGIKQIHKLEEFWQIIYRRIQKAKVEKGDA